MNDEGEWIVKDIETEPSWPPLQVVQARHSRRVFYRGGIRLNPRGLYSGLELILFNNGLGGVLTPEAIMLIERNNQLTSERLLEFIALLKEVVN